MTVIELNRLKKYIYSPYFNANDDIKQLFDIFHSNIKSKKIKKTPLTKEFIWRKIYKSKPFNDKNYRKINSILLKLLQGFFAQEEYESNSIHKANYLLQAVSKKKIDELYNSSFRYARRLAEVQYEKPPSYYFYMFQLEKSYFQLTSVYDKQKKTRKSQKENPFDIETQSQFLDLYYIAEKLRHLCFVLSRSRLLKKDHEILFIDEIIQKIDQVNVTEYPPIAVYYQIYLSTIEPENLDHYYKLKELVFEHIDKFPHDIVTEIYDSTLNYCIRKINKGIEFNDELLNMYLYGLEKGYILKDGELSPTSFRNICTVGFKLGNHDWVYDFINEYQTSLNPNNRLNAVTYNMGRYYFHKKDYKVVIEKLRDVTYDDYQYELISKNTMIMAYYEMNEFDLLDSFLNSFRTFINRHKKIPEQRQLRYMNLIKIVKKMLYVTPGNKKAIEQLKTDIDNFKVIANKKWIQEKISELQ